MTKEEALKGCRVDGNVVKLPDVALDRKVYTDVKKALELIGGKWKGGKIAGFVFASDPTEFLEAVQGGEKRNLKKEFQFFATPPDLADYLVSVACPDRGSRTLEPSAGQGAIVEAMKRAGFDGDVDCYELMDANLLILAKNEQVNILGGDFLASNPEGEYDTIIANPPFSKNQDIDHFMHMVRHLKPGGRIVSVMSSHWENSKNKKETAFRKFLDDSLALVYEVDPGTFKVSGTMVGARVVVYDHPWE